MITYSLWTGLYINGVYEGSPAEGVLEKEYIITEINGIKIRSLANFSAILLNFSKDDSIQLTVVDKENTSFEVKNIVLG